MLLEGVFLLHPGLARASGCAPSNHCYGIIDWDGPALGVFTRISIATLACNGCPVPPNPLTNHLFVSDEIWLAQVNNPVHSSWVEVGYWTYGPTTGGGANEQYFWADYRPVDSIVNIHRLSAVPAGDYGHNTNFQIYRTSSSTYYVNINSTNVNLPNNSTGNTMVPDDINIGSELNTLSGVSAGHSSFSYNQWYDSQGSWHYQTRNQTPNMYYINGLHTSTNPNPPYDKWDALPSSGTGGTFTTWCC